MDGDDSWCIKPESVNQKAHICSKERMSEEGITASQRHNIGQAGAHDIRKARLRI